MTFWVTAAMALAGADPGTGQQEERASEAEVKSAFLFHFFRFVEWPKEAFESELAPYVVGVIGRDPLEGALDRAFRGKALNGRAFRLERFSGLEEAKPCHLLFVCASEKDRMDDILRAVGSRPVLVLGETEDLVRSGACLGFALEHQRIRLVINRRAVSRSGLVVSSKLFQVARSVEAR